MARGFSRPEVSCAMRAEAIAFPSSTSPRLLSQSSFSHTCCRFPHRLCTWNAIRLRRAEPSIFGPAVGGGASSSTCLTVFGRHGGHSFAHTLPTAVGNYSEVCSSMQFCPRNFYILLRPFCGRGFWNAHIGLQSVLALHSRNRTMKGSGIINVLSSLESRSCQCCILLSV